MFLYYVPQDVRLHECNLSYAIDQGNSTACAAYVECQILRNGPDGGGGMIYSHSTQRVGYYPDEQHWEQLSESRAWIGWPKQAPADVRLMLQRKQLLDGYWVELSDGNQWLVPIARKPEMDEELRWTVTLPRTLIFRNGDWLYGPVERRYAGLLDIAYKWLPVRVAAVRDDTDEANATMQLMDVSMQECISMAVTALSYNYRLGPAEVSALGLMNQFNFLGVLDALVDWSGLLELLEKKTVPSVAGADVGSSTSSGAAVAIDDTGLVSQT